MSVQKTAAENGDALTPDYITINADGTATVQLMHGFAHDGRLKKSLTMRLAVFADELAVPVTEPPLRGYAYLSHLYAGCLVPPVVQSDLIAGLLNGQDFDRLFEAQEALQKKRSELPSV